MNFNADADIINPNPITYDEIQPEPETSDVLRDIISLGFDAYPTRDEGSSLLVILVPFENLEALLDVLKKHSNDRSIIWHGKPILDSKIEFIVEGVSYLPINGIIRPKPLYEIIKDYFSSVVMKDMDAYSRLNTELVTSNEFTMGSSANYGIDALSKLDQEFDGKIRLTMRFDTNYFDNFQQIQEDKDYLYQFDDSPEDDDVLDEENDNDMFQEYMDDEAEAEQNFQALLEETFIAQQEANLISNQNFDALVQATSDLAAYDYDDHLEKEIRGSGIIGGVVRNSKKLYNDFNSNMSNLVYYYPNESEVHRLIKTKENILNFIQKHFKHK